MWSHAHLGFILFLVYRVIITLGYQIIWNCTGILKIGRPNEEGAVDSEDNGLRQILAKIAVRHGEPFLDYMANMTIIPKFLMH